MSNRSLLKIFSIVASFIALAPLQAQIYTDSCGDFADCDACSTCPDQFWLEADYLYWQVKDSPKVIPLVIKQTAVSRPLAMNKSLLNVPSKVVLGGKKIKNDWHSGAKFALGAWFDEDKCFGTEVSYFFLGRNSKHSSVASNVDGSPSLRVPYINVTTDLPASSPISTPGLYEGGASLRVSNKMQGAELNFLSEIPSRNCSSVKILAGFRYWNFKDRLTFSVTSPLVVRPTVYRYQDKFDTQNNFYGGQIGACFEQDFSCFFVDVKGKVALGAMCQKSSIEGYFQTNEFTGSVQTFAGGFFALPTNIGHYKKNRLSVIPELNLNMGYNITDCFNVQLGYSVIYANKVLRASKQMNNRINPTQSANIEFTPTPALVGKPSPKPKLRSTGLWVQGLNVCLYCTF